MFGIGGWIPAASYKIEELVIIPSCNFICSLIHKLVRMLTSGSKTNKKLFQIEITIIELN